jgi:nitrogen regulatory protein PII
MIPHYRAIKITAILHKDAHHKVWSGLKNAGVYHIHHEPGRYPVLGLKKGFLSSILNSDPIIDNPMSIFSIIVFPDIENEVMEIVRKSADLQIPGHGSVYSEDITVYHENSLYFVTDTIQADKPKEKFFKGLTGIFCILPRGFGEPVSKILLENGIGVPTVTYGSGTGLRDKLGLLKITLPREKDILKLVVNSSDAEHVMNFIIEAGQLESPGRGFIYEYPVKHGLINTRVSLDGSRHTANIDQIIAALDRLHGNVEWRKRSSNNSYTNSNRNFFSGVDVHFYCNEGFILEIIKELRKLGVSGSTMKTLKLISKNEDAVELEHEPRIKISPARESCNMLVPEKNLPEILEELEKIGAFGSEIQGMLYTTQIPRAFTYQSKRKFNSNPD